MKALCLAPDPAHHGPPARTDLATASNRMFRLAYCMFPYPSCCSLNGHAVVVPSRDVGEREALEAIGQRAEPGDRCGAAGGDGGERGGVVHRAESSAAPERVMPTVAFAVSLKRRRCAVARRP